MVCRRTLWHLKQGWCENPDRSQCLDRLQVRRDRPPGIARSRLCKERSSLQPGVRDIDSSIEVRGSPSVFTGYFPQQFMLVFWYLIYNQKGYISDLYFTISEIKTCECALLLDSERTLPVALLQLKHHRPSARFDRQLREQIQLRESLLPL